MFFAALSRADAYLLATSLDLGRAACRANGVVLGETLEQMRRCAWDRVNGDSEGQDDQDGAKLAALVDRLHAPPMLHTYLGAARLLAISERAVKRLVAEGRLPVVHVGGSARIRQEDVEQFVASLGNGSFRDRVQAKNAPASPSTRPAGRRAVGGRGPSGSASQPRGAA